MTKHYYYFPFMCAAPFICDELAWEPLCDLCWAPQCAVLAWYPGANHVSVADVILRHANDRVSGYLLRQSSGSIVGGETGEKSNVVYGSAIV